ncbi:MAG: Ig-like domain-containing protein [Bacteroidota bacterium]
MYRKQNKSNISIKKQFIFVGIFIAIVAIITSCANIGMPTGGPKDVTPPKVLKSIPKNYSTQFKGKEIEITFDEFIKFKDLNSQLLISPPLKNTPDIKIKGKNIVVKINDTLRENTTYTMFFGDAIVDLNEENILPSYEFVFSTGNVLDSLTMTGKVLNAFTQKPEKDIYVMLYDKYDDSVPIKEKPYYLAKTKEDGEFVMNNLRDMSYKVFALKDANNNLKFDQPNEKIAFIDSLVTPRMKPILLKKDSLHKDTLKLDSLNKAIVHDKNLYIKDLNLFEEVDSTQRVTKADYLHKGELIFTFRFPVKDLEIIPQFETKKEWKLEEMNATKDTLYYWLLDPMDSCKFIIKDNNKTLDTVNLKHRQRVTVKKKSTVAPSIILSTNINGMFDFYNYIVITAPNPIETINPKNILLIEDKDTLHPKISFTDSLHRRIMLNHKLKQGINYKLYVPDSIVKDIFGMYNDSLGIPFRTNNIEDVGNFIVNISIDSSSAPCILQLLSDKEDIIEQHIITIGTTIKYQYLKPGSYLLKAIYDQNNNGKWDTGKYLIHLQPEKIIYFPDKITIRANWDVEEKWKL